MQSHTQLQFKFKLHLDSIKTAAANLLGGAALVFCIGAQAAANQSAEIQSFRASRVVDLTHALHNDMAFWPGGVPFNKERLVDYADGYQLHKFSMGENTGTHVDAPSHFIRGKKPIDRLALDQLIVPMVVFDARRAAAANSDYELRADDIKQWESQHGKVPANSLFIMHTGWHKRFNNPAKYANMDGEQVMHFPGYAADAAELLVARDVAGIGIDTFSIDRGASKTFDAHHVMLKANKYQIENLAALDKLPATGATAVVGVLPVRGGSQAQARIFALLP